MRLLTLLVLLLWPLGGHAMPADLVIVADHVVTLTDTDGATAVAVSAGKISWIGAAADVQAHVGPKTRVIRAGGTLLPGLVDSHAHLSSLGRSLEQVDLVDTQTIPSIRAKVKAALATGSDAEWILGRGWDQNDWSIKAFPHAGDLDVVSKTRPIALTRIDGHALWVNTAALRLAGITAKTPDPAGGRIVRGPDGAPTGVLLDEAMALVRAKIPAPPPAQLRRWIERAVAECHRVGLTGVHDAGTSAADLAILRAMEAEGRLTLRVYTMLMPDDPGFEAVFAKGPQTGEFVDARAIKMFADGALGSRGAWLKHKYADAQGKGIPITHGAPLRKRVGRYFAAGYQVGVHAIGDAAADDVMTAYETVLRPGMDRRYRIEHAQIVSPADQRRMAALGVIAMVQPTHATSDMPWAEARLGPKRIRHAYAWRSLKNAGVRLSLGSDFPVERPAPVAGLSAAVTRQDLAGKPAGGWYPNEALTAREAVEGFTQDAAFAGFHEARRGRIAIGLDADFTLLDRNPLTIPPAALKALQIKAVVVAGQVVFAAKL